MDARIIFNSINEIYDRVVKELHVYKVKVIFEMEGRSNPIITIIGNPGTIHCQFRLSYCLGKNPDAWEDLIENFIIDFGNRFKYHLTKGE